MYHELSVDVILIYELQEVEIGSNQLQSVVLLVHLILVSLVSASVLLHVFNFSFSGSCEVPDFVACKILQNPIA